MSTKSFHFFKSTVRCVAGIGPSQVGHAGV